MNSENSATVSPARPMLPPPLLIGMVVAALWGAAAAARGEDWAFHLGASIWGALVVWAVVWFGFLKRRREQKAWVVYLWIYAAMACAAATMSIYHGNQEATARSSLTSTLNAYEQGARDIDVRPAATGETGEVEAFLKRTLAAAANARRDYEAELAGVGIEDLFTESSLTQKDWLTQARFRLRRSSEIVAKYEAQSEALNAGLAGQVEALPISPVLKQQMLTGIAEGERTKGADRLRAWQIEKQILAEYNSGIDLLARAQGYWQFEDGQIAFQRQADLDAFRGHLARVERLAKEQEALMQRLQAGMREALRPKAD